MPTITYEDYISSLSTADQLTALDVVPVKQGAAIKTTALLNDIDDHIAATYVMPKALFEDATAGDILLDIIGKEDVFVWKTDATLHKIYISDSSGATVELGDEVILYKQGEGIHLVYDASTNNWYTSEKPYDTVILANAASADQTVVIPELRNMIVVKTDDSSHVVTLQAPIGFTFAEPAPVLYNQYESIQLRTNGTTIYTVRDGDVVPFYSVTILPVSETTATVVELNALLAPADITLNEANTEYIIMRVDAGSAFTSTITAPVGYTINRAASYELALGGESVHLRLSGTNYISI